MLALTPVTVTTTLFRSENAPVLAVAPWMDSMPRTLSYSVTQYSRPVVADIVPAPCVTITPTAKVVVLMQTGKEVMPVAVASKRRFCAPLATYWRLAKCEPTMGSAVEPMVSKAANVRLPETMRAE